MQVHRKVVRWKQVYLHVTTQYCMVLRQRLKKCNAKLLGLRPRPKSGCMVSSGHSQQPPPLPPYPIHFSYRATHLVRRPPVRSTIIIIRTPPPPPPPPHFLTWLRACTYRGTVTKRFRDIYVEFRHVRKRRSTVATRLLIAVSL